MNTPASTDSPRPIPVTCGTSTNDGVGSWSVSRARRRQYCSVDSATPWRRQKRLLRKPTALVPRQQLPPLRKTASLNPMTLGARFARRVRVSLVLHAPRYYSSGGCATTLCSVGRLQVNGGDLARHRWLPCHLIGVTSLCLRKHKNPQAQCLRTLTSAQSLPPITPEERHF
jgi:hypothetical protein